MSEADTNSAINADDKPRLRADERLKAAAFRDFMPSQTLFPFNFQSEGLAAHTPRLVSMQDLADMRRDPQIVLGLATLKSPILNTSRFYIEGRDSEVAEAARAAIMPVLADMIAACLLSLDFGFSVSEQRWAVRDLDVSQQGEETRRVIPGAYVPLAPFTIAPWNVDVLTDKRGMYSGVELFGGGSSISAALDARVPKNVVLSPGETLFVTFRGEFGNMLGESVLHPAWVPWRYSAVVRKLWGRFLEKFALGSYLSFVPPDVVRETPDGGQVNLVEQANTAMVNLRGGGAAALPSEFDPASGERLFDVRILESTREGRAFSEAVTFFEAAKLRAMLVPERTVTQDVLTGSHSMASAHAELFLLSLDAIVEEQVLQPLSAQIVEPFARLNFPGRAAPRLCASKLSRETRSALYTILAAALGQTLTMPDGRVYTPASLIDYPQLLEQLNIAHRGVEEVASEPPKPEPAAAAAPKPSLASTLAVVTQALGGIR